MRPRPPFPLLPISRLTLIALALFSPALLHALTLTVRPLSEDGVYALGEAVAWQIQSSETADFSAPYSVRQNSGTEIAAGLVTLTNGQGTVHLAPGLPAEPAALFLRVTATPQGGGNTVVALGGAIVAPEAIRPARTYPEDFDAFWAGKLAEQRALPFAAVLTPETTNRADVLLWSFTLDMPDGSLAHGQIARPLHGDHFPAMIILQYAGVYALSKGTVVNRAAEGWLAINVMAHDLPIYESAAFYSEQQAGPLNAYGSQGNHSREEAYLLGMLLRAARAADFLAAREDWDGEAFVATGTSKGGYQAIALAALDDRITAVAANVPAACEMVGQLDGRAQPWPYWMNRNVTPFNRDDVIAASAYFDAVNFASRVRAPVLVSLGLIDTTCPPAGVLSMASQLKGPREIIIMPLAPHQSANNAHAAFYARSDDFLRAPPPPLPEEPYEPGPLDPWTGAKERGEGHYHLPEWGAFHLMADPAYVFHHAFGWLHLPARDPEGFHFYHFATGWHWTQRAILPWAWDYTRGKWDDWTH